MAKKYILIVVVCLLVSINFIVPELFGIHKAAETIQSSSHKVIHKLQDPKVYESLDKEQLIKISTAVVSHVESANNDYQKLIHTANELYFWLNMFIIVCVVFVINYAFKSNKKT